MRMTWLFGHGNAPRAPVVVALLVLLNALLLRAVDPDALVRLRDLAFDSYQRIKPREVPADLPVRIVDIDEAALAEYGQWPWPRTLLARMVDRLREQGALVVTFDIVFAEPDRISPSAVAKNLPEAVRNSDLRRTLEALPDNDEVFAEAIARANVVTGFAFDASAKGAPPRRMWGVAHNSGERDAKTGPDLIRQFIPQQTGVVATLPLLEQAAKGDGSVTPVVEGAIVRHVPMLFRLAGQRDEDLYPALSAESVRVAQGASTYLVRWSGAQGLESFGERTGVGSIRVGDITINTDAQGRMALYDSGHKPSRFVSAKDVLKRRVPASRTCAIRRPRIRWRGWRSTPRSSSRC
jgi:adenylate cyclase